VRHGTYIQVHAWIQDRPVRPGDFWQCSVLDGATFDGTGIVVSVGERHVHVLVRDKLLRVFNNSNNTEEICEAYTCCAGPCASCGERDYSLSVGGPGVCVPCDLGSMNLNLATATNDFFGNLNLATATNDFFGNLNLATATNDFFGNNSERALDLLDKPDPID